MIRHLCTWFRGTTQPFNPPQWDHIPPESWAQSWNWVILNGTNAVTPVYLRNECSAETFIRRKLMAMKLTH